MSDAEHFREVARWLRYAEDDLRSAEVLLEQGSVPRNSCFLARQAAEKSIKAIFVFLQTNFPKTHNLRQLCEMLPEGWHFGEEPTRLSSLTVWVVEPRYPGDLPEAGTEDAVDAVRLARETYETTLANLERRGYAPEGSQ